LEVAQRCEMGKEVEEVEIPKPTSPKKRAKRTSRKA